jgi:hypothetical protein
LFVTSAKTPLCDECRGKFINYPIPKWIKAFGIGIVAVLIFSLFSLSKNLQTGIHYRRGVDAATQKNYLTAEKEFQKVIKKEPDYKEGQTHLLIAAFYNGDMEAVRDAFLKIENETFAKDDLYAQVNAVLAKVGNYIPRDSFLTVLQKYGMNADSVPDKEFLDYLKKDSTDIYAACTYAGRLQDKKQLKQCDSILSVALAADPQYKLALQLKVPVKRELNQIDSAYYYVDQLLNINHQDLYALASEVRVLLKEKKDDEALALAKKCVAMDDKNAYSLCSLALAYHFKNDIADRNAIITNLEKDSSALNSLSYIKDVISGKEIFRN